MNYLERIPCRNIPWHSSDDLLVTLEIKNKGILKKLTQKLFKKPETSYIHLDRFGSFIWHKIDGKTSVFEISQLVKDEFDELAEPLHERLTNFFAILKNNNFITWKL